MTNAAGQGTSAGAVKLVGIFDSRRSGSQSAHHVYHLVFLCVPLGGLTQAPSHPQEVREARWLAEREIPADLSPGHAARMPYIWQAWRGANTYLYA